MKYNFSDLNAIQVLNKEVAKEKFLYFFELRKQYPLDFEVYICINELEHYLLHDIYFLINNIPRYKGKKVFFTGHAVVVTKEELLKALRKEIDLYNSIIPVLIVLYSEEEQIPEYSITSQEDPIFTAHIFKNEKSKNSL